MSRKLKSHASPPMIVAMLALVVALGGTAIAATGVLSGKQKKQVGKIASKVFRKNIGSASVNHATSADSATQATKANTATKATEANKAATAAKATEATKAETATRANEATKALTATTAATATKATDADQLGGQPAAFYQLKLGEQCPAPEAISEIDPEGIVHCDKTSIRAISQLNDAGQPAGTTQLPGGLQFTSSCHDGVQTKLRFQNLGGTDANLNWFYGTGSGATAAGTTVTKSGTGTSEETFSFAGGRIEGQFIWIEGRVVNTLNLHAVDLGAKCEINGTVVTAAA